MSNRVWIGIIFLVFGVGFFLQQANVLDFSSVLSIWWPLILIIIGVVQLVSRTHTSSISGLLFILVGGLFLANQLVDVNLVTYLWPLILVFIGFVFLFSRSTREKTVDTNRDLNTIAIFSGAEVRSQSKSFQGGTVTTVFGGAEIDLRDIVIVEKGATIDLSAVFGGISLTVPENIQIEVTGIPILGGWEDKTRSVINDDDVSPVLTLNCLAICGGIEIKD